MNWDGVFNIKSCIAVVYFWGNNADSTWHSSDFKQNVLLTTIFSDFIIILQQFAASINGEGKKKTNTFLLFLQ